VNHASNYGIGKIKLADALDVTAHEADMFLKIYHRTYPEVEKLYQHRIKDSVDRHSKVVNPLGRVYRIMDRKDLDLYQRCYSWFAQSTIADIVNRGGLRYFCQNPEVFEHAELLNQIHDSITVQIPLSAGWDQHSQVLEALMQSLLYPLHAHGIDFVLPVEVVLHTANLKDSVLIETLDALTLERAYNESVG